MLKVQLKKYVGAVQMLKREASQLNDGKDMVSVNGESLNVIFVMHSNAYAVSYQAIP